MFDELADGNSGRRERRCIIGTPTYCWSCNIGTSVCNVLLELERQRITSINASSQTTKEPSQTFRHPEILKATLSWYQIALRNSEIWLNDKIRSFFYHDASYKSWRWRRGTNFKKRVRDIYCGNELMPALTRGPGCKLSHCERRAVLIKMVLMAIVHLSLHIRHQKSKLRIISLWVRTGPNLDWIKVQFLAVLNCGSQDVFLWARWWSSPIAFSYSLESGRLLRD